MEITTAMIFAAGLGTRLRPYTNDRPKALVEVGGMTLLEIQVRRLAHYGVRKIVVNIHHFAELMEREVEKLRGKKRHPTIEDHVTIYPGATILGGETVIGEGSTVNGNVFLVQSVPPQCRVAHEKHALVVTPLKR